MGEAKRKEEAYQATAQLADKMTYEVLTTIGGDQRHDVTAVVAGAVMALVRFVIAAHPPPPTVRAVFNVLLPSINRSAEQIIEQIQTQEQLRADMEARLNREANEDDPTIQ